tara:strand:- start:1419 stop:1745 length:327 start_codon:yes stop_codon:yes gene_type:complete
MLAAGFERQDWFEKSETFNMDCNHNSADDLNYVKTDYINSDVNNVVMDYLDLVVDKLLVPGLNCFPLQPYWNLIFTANSTVCHISHLISLIKVQSFDSVFVACVFLHS